MSEPVYKYRLCDGVESFKLIEIVKRARASFDLSNKPVTISRGKLTSYGIVKWEQIWSIRAA